MAVIALTISTAFHIEELALSSYNPEAFPEEIYFPPPRNVEPSRPMIALTFDDGPALPTIQILDILEQHNSAATFFIEGRVMYAWDEGAEVVRRIHRSGSEAVGHTWNHPVLTTISAEEVAWELLEIHYALEELLEHPVPRIFRPPHSAHNATVRQVAKDLGFAIILWSRDTGDWDVQNAEIIASRVLDFVRDGDIVVMHDIIPETAIAMETVIPELIARGYQLVTVSELFYYRGITLQPGNVYRNAPPRN